MEKFYSNRRTHQAHPRLARWIGPPCFVRIGNAYPVCTEGSHCGVRVWEGFPNIERRI